MRVLVVSQYFWPENFRINELMQSLVRKGIDVEVITGKPNYPGGVIYDGYVAAGCIQEEYFGMQLHRMPLIPRGTGSFGLFLNYISFVFSGLIFAPRKIQGKQFDLIFVYAPSPILQAIPAIYLGWLKKCPKLLWVQDLWPESLSATGQVTQPAVLHLVERVVRWIYKKMDLLLVQSPAFTPKVRALSGSTPIVYYPNSFPEINTCVAPQDVLCPSFDCDFPVLFAGNIGTAQAVNVVLEAATLLRNIEGIRFVMVGDGSRREWLMQQAVDRGLSNIDFPGRYPVEAMSALMGKAAALLVTLADKEIFGLTIPSKIQAYLAAGRPIIACLNGIGAEIVRESGAGVAVAAEDAAALAEAVRALYKMPAPERFVMGQRGRKYYDEHFSHEKLVNELIVHFEHAVQRKRGLAS
jgi:glycosyltransferase involved in cell wall biosynthesis